MELPVPKIKIKRQTNYYVSRKFEQDHGNPSNDIGSNVKLTEELEPTDDAIDANDLIDLFNSSDIKFKTAASSSTAFSENELDLPTDLPEQKPIARSRKPLRHGFQDGFRELNNYIHNIESELKNGDLGKDLRGGNSNNNNRWNERGHKHQFDSNYQHHHGGINKEESDSQHGRESHISSFPEKGKLNWKKSHSADVHNNTNNKAVSRSVIDEKKRKKKTKLSLVSFNKVLTNNNINNNNNAAGAYNYNSLDSAGMASGIKSGQPNCWFVVCVSLYVNDAVINKSNQHNQPNQNINHKIESYENI